MGRDQDDNAGPIDLPLDAMEAIDDGLGAFDLPSTLLSSEIEPHSFHEHMAALGGPALDPVHMYLRSLFPKGIRASEHESVAALVKTRHDLAFWSSMIDLGRSGAFTDHLPSLREDLALLQRFVPSHTGLMAVWRLWKTELHQALPN